MKHKSSWRVSTLIVVVIICLGALFLYYPEEEITAEDIRRYMLELDSNDNPDNPFIREQAEKLAMMLFKNPSQGDEFAHELTELYFRTREVDFLIIYNTGGFGGTTMAQDPEWPSVLEGTQAKLKELGYNCIIREHQRAGSSIIEFTSEVEQIFDYYSAKAPILAAKIAFLTKYNPKLKVITTGRCFGALLSGEVMELLEDNLQVCTIQAGRPFWFPPPRLERTLVINNNGIMPDAKARGDIWGIIQANATRLPTTSPPKEGSCQILRWYFKAPGHAYTWQHPGVESQITAFLYQNFEPRELE